MELRSGIRIISGACALLMCATNALAVISSPDGWYVSGNVGTPHVIKSGSTGGGTSIKGVGLSGSLGYKWMPYLGTEAGYSWYGQSSLNDSFGVKAYEVKHRAYHLAFKAMLPIEATGAELFAKLGAERLTSSATVEDATAAANVGTIRRHTNTGPFMAVGGEYYFTPELAASLSWQRAKGSGETGIFDLYSIGLVYLVG